MTLTLATDVPKITLTLAIGVPKKTLTLDIGVLKMTLTLAIGVPKITLNLHSHNNLDIMPSVFINMTLTFVIGLSCGVVHVPCILDCYQN
jgi:cytochrome c biogenesis protein CcdA